MKENTHPDYKKPQLNVFAEMKSKQAPLKKTSQLKFVTLAIHSIQATKRF